MMLCSQMADGFPKEKKLWEYYQFREHLTRIDGVVVPTELRPMAHDAVLFVSDRKVVVHALHGHRAPRTECRIVTEDSDGTEINISGQAFVSFRIQLCGKTDGAKEATTKGCATPGKARKGKVITMVSKCRYDPKKLEGNYGQDNVVFKGSQEVDGTG